MSRAATFVACLGCLLSAGIARADEKGACIAAHERGQEVRLANHWVEAQRLFLACAQPSCPGLVVQDCTRWEGELTQHIPSLVVAARRADGADVDDVALFVDGVPFGARLPAVPIPLDPGEHVLRFEHAGSSAIEQRVILHDGEQHRSVQVRFDAPSFPSKPAGGGAPVGAYAAAAVAAGVTAVSVTFLVMGKVREHDLATSPCGAGGTCTDAQVNPIRVDYVVSGITAGVAAVAVGIAVWQLVAHGSHPTTAEAWPLRFAF
jgi:hypothetical protein